MIRTEPAPKPLPDDWSRFWEHLAELFENCPPPDLKAPQKAA